MLLDPVPGDIDPPANPHLVVTLDVVEEPRERRGAPGPTDEAHVLPLEGDALPVAHPDIRVELVMVLGRHHIEGVVEALCARVAGLRARSARAPAGSSALKVRPAAPTIRRTQRHRVDSFWNGAAGVYLSSAPRQSHGSRSVPLHILHRNGPPHR